MRFLQPLSLLSEKRLVRTQGWVTIKTISDFFKKNLNARTRKPTQAFILRVLIIGEIGPAYFIRSR